MLLIMVGTLAFFPSEPTFAAETVAQSVTVLASVVSAIVMLPALRRLRPRMIEG
jgi:hypothetical protein